MLLDLNPWRSKITAVRPVALMVTLGVTRKRTGLLALIAAGLTLSGCTEVAMIRSYPPGAKLYVNDRFVGIAPIIYSIPHSEIGAVHRVHLERDGYRPLDSSLRTQICGGRIAGGIFTLGIVLLIRGPTCLVSPQDFSLEPLPGAASDASGSEAAHGPTIEERLKRLERMRDKGDINQQEYEQYRREILKSL